MSVLTNDNAALEPKTEFAGRTLTFDLPKLRIGVAEYAEGPTGCTVFHFPEGAMMAADVRGGASGTFMTEPSMFRHAICLAGGSLYGLEASAGVAAELFAQRDYTVQFQDFALVAGAIVYDFGPRQNAIYPDKALGRAALRVAREGLFPLGPRGAGVAASVGKWPDFTRAERSGQGGAFRQIGETKLGVFSVVNAMGTIIDRAGNAVRGQLDRARREHVHPADEVESRLRAGSEAQPAPAGNTTLTVLVTNQRLGQYELTQLSRQVHSSMARAIQPFHTTSDGDVLYAVTTNEVVPSSLVDDATLGVIASELAWDAVLSSFDLEG